MTRGHDGPGRTVPTRRSAHWPDTTTVDQVPVAGGGAGRGKRVCANNEGVLHLRRQDVCMPPPDRRRGDDGEEWRRAPQAHGITLEYARRQSMLRMRWGGFLATRKARRGLSTRVYRHLDACGLLCTDFADSERRLKTVYERSSCRRKKVLPLQLQLLLRVRILCY